ncbi:MAG: hypothetical protein LBR22_07535 [Desulfovibrio sp.]|jgi:hypothetical protein|nr:hypothetical protein [Desulfovibrio sp.]
MPNATMPMITGRVTFDHMPFYIEVMDDYFCAGYAQTYSSIIGNTLQGISATPMQIIGQGYLDKGEKKLKDMFRFEEPDNNVEYLQELEKINKRFCSDITPEMIEKQKKCTKVFCLSICVGAGMAFGSVASMDFLVQHANAVDDTEELQKHLASVEIELSKAKALLALAKYLYKVQIAPVTARNRKRKGIVDDVDDGSVEASTDFQNFGEPTKMASRRHRVKRLFGKKNIRSK